MKPMRQPAKRRIDEDLNSLVGQVLDSQNETHQQPTPKTAPAGFDSVFVIIFVFLLLTIIPTPSQLIIHGRFFFLVSFPSVRRVFIKVYLVPGWLSFAVLLAFPHLFLLLFRSFWPFLFFRWRPRIDRLLFPMDTSSRTLFYILSLSLKTILFVVVVVVDFRDFLFLSSIKVKVKLIWERF